MAPAIDRDLLDIYLSDHYAGSTAGLDLARRMAESERHGGALGEIAAEIESDRKTLRALMSELDLSPSRLKMAIGWISEKAGRLKLNDRIIGRSPLSRLVELEGLIVGVSGKLQLWRALAQIEPSDPRFARFDFSALGLRAEAQRSRLEELHKNAAREALAAES